MNKKWLVPGVHMLAWALLAVSDVRDFMTTFQERPYDVKWIRASGLPPLAAAFVKECGYQFVLMVAFYGAYIWIGPSLFPRRRYGRALLSVIAVLSIMVATRAVVEFWVLRPLLHFENYFGHPLDLWWYTTNCIGYSYNYCLFGIILFFFIRSGRIQREKAEAELAFLRSQVNPHFLFNTINDIYSLVYRQRAEAPEALLKLSGILRYMLYEESRHPVSLEKELTYLRDYLDLQRIGANQQLYIDLRVEGDMSSLHIAPLLLIPFVENMVKHGVVNDPDHPATLHVRAEEGRFHLSAINRLKPQQKDTTGGIGLHNVRRRLELLYPGTHTFQVTEWNNEFHCVLNLSLTA
jgi:hypothetical protein